MSNKFAEMRLIKQQDETRIIIQNSEFRKEVCTAIAQGLCTVPEDIVNLFNITYDQAITLLNDPTFLSQIKKQTQAKLQLKYHTVIPNELSKIITNGDNKEKLQAIKMYAQLTDNLKNTGTDVNINLNLENLVKEAEKPINNPILNTEFKKVS
jgi:hypothetical protein